jgi:hypothetical protein
MRPRHALSIALLLAACGKDAAKKNEPAPKPADPPASAPAAPATQPTPPAAAPDPDALGFCEYTIDGANPNRGGGGLMNVGSLYWIPVGQKGRSIAGPLLINCGKGKQLNISAAGSAEADYPQTAKKYMFDPSNKNGTFTVMGPDFMSAKDGELEITAWDNVHVAGSFKFNAGGKAYAGTFDLKCPQPGNGICEK